MQVLRPYSLLRDLFGLDQRFGNIELLTGGKRIGPQSPWRYFGQAGNPALLSPWSGPSGADPADLSPPRFCRDERNTVHLSGFLRPNGAAGVNIPILYVPAGLGVAQPQRWPAASAEINDNIGFTRRSYLYMVPGGPLTLYTYNPNYPTPAADWVSLDGISWSIT